MPDYLARRPMTLNGRKIPAGERVPMEELHPSRQRQLIEHGHVTTHSNYTRIGAESSRQRGGKER